MSDPQDRLLARLVKKAEVGYPPFQDRPDSPWQHITETDQIPSELRDGKW